ncbi:cation-translocating P-type ATPase [Streptomyces sp. NPDC051219]|uniref:cation-translocating P-type ATPase n=1 Tax=Streptomyces sp. NPDC051219 TaxID=3155283 RepID=UPI0034305B65
MGIAIPTLRLTVSFVAPPAVAKAWNAIAGPTRAVSAAPAAGAAAVLSGARDAAASWASAGRRTVEEAVGSLPERFADTMAAVTGTGDRRTRRRVWSGAGRAHIEVRGLTGSGEQHHAMADAVLAGVRQLEGIHWAEVNAALGQVLIAFDDDQVGTDRLVAVVEAVEQATGAPAEPFPETPAAPPFDPVPASLAAVSLAADCLGMAVAAAWRLWPLPPLPRGLRAPMVLAHTQPRIHHMLQDRLGVAHADMLLAVANAVVHAATAGAAGLGLDAVHHLLLWSEIRSRQQVWHHREAALAAQAEHLPTDVPVPPARPVPLPAGPVESCADRTAAATLLAAAGVLTVTHSPARAAETILATAPKAAALGREAFTCLFARALARDKAVPLRGEALRVLDRISAVVIDSAVLCTPRCRVLSVSACGDLDDAAVWGTAHTALAERHLLDFAGEGPWEVDGWRLEHAEGAPQGPLGGHAFVVLDLVDADGRRQGTVHVGCELDPLADALIAAARSGADRVVITEHPSTVALRPLADEVLPAVAPLAEEVRRLQADGHGVLLIAEEHAEALQAADLGVAVLPRSVTGPGHWHADLVCGPGLHQTWRLLHALDPARQVSARSARLSTGASVLGALMTATGERAAAERATAPVHAAAGLALLSGALTAHKMSRTPLPPARMHGAWHALGAREVMTMVQPPPGTDRRPGAEESAGPTGWEHAMARFLTRLPPVAAFPGPARHAAALARAVREELRDPLTPVLALGAAASAVVGSSADSVLVGGVMVGNALISGIQRMGATRALKGLLLREQLTARRLTWTASEQEGDFPAGLDAAPVSIVSADDVRVGDVIRLQDSDVVPADARLLAAEDLEIDEASLTGESVPVAKDPRPIPGADLADRACMVYQGCTVLAGSGYAVVVATGSHTEAGRAAEVAGPARTAVGIEGHLAHLTKVALPATGIGGAAVTLLALLRGQALRNALASGVAIAVAAVPEGLPLVATVAQSAAARRLARRAVLVRSPRVLEALGRVDTICFDKTGTLTEGRLSVTRTTTADQAIPLTSPHGRRLLHVAARACPTATDGGGTRLIHATDRAVVDAATVHAGEDTDWRPTDELPFLAERGYSASLGTDPHGPYLAVKGAPEIVLELCTTISDPAHPERPTRLDADRRQQAEALVQSLADEGLRVLAVAEARPPSVNPSPDTTPVGPVADLTLLGFTAIADTTRPGASEAVRSLAAAGLRTVMITGDHPVTAAAVARDLGIPGTEAVLTGTDLESLPEQARLARVTETSVFARISPEQKVRIVRDLQRAGRVVAMVGDGTNDAAAIRASDVGIGMAARGSTSARSASDLVLTDPDPTHILHALREARALWGSVRDAAAILVGGNAGEVAFTVLGTALAGRAPLSTRQLLLVNLLTDMLPALAVALAPAKPPGADPDSFMEGPVPALLGRDMARILAIRGASTAIGALAAWQGGRMTGRTGRANTMGLAALVGTQLGQTLLTGRHSITVVATSAASAVLLFALVQTPGISHFFGCTPLGPLAWTIVLACAAAATAAAALAPRVVPAATPAPLDASPG